MNILSIETSCDETSAAIVKDDNGIIEVISNIISSQINIHKEYGGVVPEIAARHHVININPVIDEAMQSAKVTKDDIDLIAVTSGPGLITSLIVGTEAAKSLALAWDKPVIAVNHMYAHLAANFLNNKIKFPALALIVSGGHTELIILKDHNNFKKIGQTVDDAAGEAFDKVAKLLGLGYPGGPAISKLAENGNANAFDLPRPMINSKDFNFSFSGLKTAVLYKLKEINLKDKNDVSDMCASFQQAAVDVLIAKTISAAKKHNVKTVFMAGGVAANKKLRQELENKTKDSDLEFFVPEFEYCTDNAAMIGIAASYLADKKMPKMDNYKKIKADPNWELE